MDRRQVIVGGTLAGVGGLGTLALFSGGSSSQRVAVGARTAEASLMPLNFVGTPEAATFVGRQVSLEGWLTPVRGADHYMILRSNDDGAAASGLVRVYPRDVRTLRAGPVVLSGRYFDGAFIDQVSSDLATSVLLDAI